MHTSIEGHPRTAPLVVAAAAIAEDSRNPNPETDANPIKCTIAEVTIGASDTLRGFTARRTALMKGGLDLVEGTSKALSAVSKLLATTVKSQITLGSAPMMPRPRKSFGGPRCDTCHWRRVSRAISQKSS